MVEQVKTHKSPRGVFFRAYADFSEKFGENEELKDIAYISGMSGLSYGERIKRLDAKIEGIDFAKYGQNEIRYVEKVLELTRGKLESNIKKTNRIRNVDLSGRIERQHEAMSSLTGLTHIISSYDTDMNKANVDEIVSSSRLDMPLSHLYRLGSKPSASVWRRVSTVGAGLVAAGLVGLAALVGCSKDDTKGDELTELRTEKAELKAERDLLQIRFNAKSGHLDDMSKEKFSLSNEVYVLKSEKDALNTGLNDYSNKAEVAVSKVKLMEKLLRPSPPTGLPVVVPQDNSQSVDSKKNSSLETKLNSTQKKNNAQVQKGSCEIGDPTNTIVVSTTHYNPHKKGSFSQKQAEVNIADYRGNLIIHSARNNNLKIVDAGPIPLATQTYTSCNVSGIYRQYSVDQGSRKAKESWGKAGTSLKEIGKDVIAVGTASYGVNEFELLTKDDFRPKKTFSKLVESVKEFGKRFGGPFTQKDRYAEKNAITGTVTFLGGLVSGAVNVGLDVGNTALLGIPNNFYGPAFEAEHDTLETLKHAEQGSLNPIRGVSKSEKAQKRLDRIINVPSEFVSNVIGMEGFSNTENPQESMRLKGKTGYVAEFLGSGAWLGYGISEALEDHESNHVKGGGNGGEGGGVVDGGGYGGEGGL